MNLHRDLKGVCVFEEEIPQEIQRLADEINAKNVGKKIVVVVVLKGAVVFSSDLLKKVNPDIVESVEYIQASSYGSRTESSGDVILVKDVDKDVFGKNVLLIEDIIDSGNSLEKIIDLFEAKGVASLQVCVLLNKEVEREKKILLDYVGFVIPNDFVVGYGLDYNEKYRTLPYIGILREEIYTPN